jgi:diguanylate cyclase (GGDEF)-like protein
MLVKNSPLPVIPADLHSLALAQTSAAICIVQPVLAASGKTRDVRFCYVNPSFSMLTGLTSDALVGQRLRGKVAILDCRDMWKLLLPAFGTGCAQTGNVRSCKKGVSRLLEISVVPVSGQLVVTINDITTLSDSDEIRELQSRLMDENAQAVESLHASLAAEIASNARMKDKLARTAVTDSLSGLANRRSFMGKSAAEFRRSRRFGHALSLVMLDLDKFKQVNDIHGHPAGDAVIRAVSQICESLSRIGTDCIGRLEGEEFGILLPECDLDGAHIFAERLRQTIETTPIFADTVKIMITASMGITTMRQDDENIAAIMKRAESALLVAKNTGRNKVSDG